MATVTKPIALNESLNTTETPSRNVADVLAEELSAIAQAIGGGGGQGGHTIEGADGTALSQEPTLQFADADATDDAVNEKTVVNVVRERTQAEYEAMSAADQAKGIIHITDADAKPLFDTQVRRSNGDGTVADALDVELNVDVQYTNSNITIAEYFRYHRFGKMVVVDIGGMKTSNTAEQVIATSNLPIMRTRPVAVMFSNQTGSNQIRGFLYGVIGYRSFTVAIPTANTTMYAQFVYFTD